jgi:hypothetical protein
MENNMLAHLRVLGDLTSFYIAFGAIVKIIPPLAGLVSIAWVGFQFYHSPPVKEWRARRKEQNGRDS